MEIRVSRIKKNQRLRFSRIKKIKKNCFFPIFWILEMKVSRLRKIKKQKAPFLYFF